MAKQDGIIQFRGTVGNLNFQKREEGYIVGRKPGVDKERILHDPKFEYTRENMSDFSTAGKASKFVLGTFREIVLLKPDSKISGRLTKVMYAIGRTDQSHERGHKQVWAGDLSLLRNFEFNKKATLENCFFGGFAPGINRTTGVVDIQIPSFIPKEMVIVPESATFFRFVIGGVELDIEGETFIRERALSAWLPYNRVATAPITLSCTLTPASTLPLFEVFGIEYAMEEDGVKLPLKGGATNPVQIIKLDA
jgi:hypothetical protein